MKDFRGIDLSIWNGDNNLKEAKNEIDFVIIRTSYGYDDSFINSGIDEKFEENYENAKKEGLLVGVYHYSYARNIKEAELEAQRVLSVLGGRNLDLPVFYDVEDEILFLEGRDITDRIIAFVKIIQNSGYKAGFYANKYWMENYIDREKLENRNLMQWIAYYNEGLFNENPHFFKGSYDILQYTNEGRVNGVSNYGNGIQSVDMNIMYENYCNNSKKKLLEDSYEDLKDLQRPEYYLIPEEANFVLEVDKIYVREKPSRKSNRVAYYTRGEVVSYDYYTINDGHVWISYIARSGNRRYMAIGEHNGYRRTSVWGSFY